MKKKPAVFLDRDGVLLEEQNYLSSFEQIHIIPGAVEAVQKLNELYHVIVISNQSGVARGLFTLDFVAEVHMILDYKFQSAGAKIDAFYFCPHHPDGQVEEFKQECNCRKPKIGLLQRAAKQFPLEWSESYFIGDKLSDIQTALNASIRPVLVKTGYGTKTLAQYGVFIRQNHVLIADNLLQAVDQIMDNR